MPGQAIETNPLIALVCQVTPEHAADLETEIQVTEKYLAGLKAARAVVEQMGLARLPAPAEVTVVQVSPVPAQEPAPAPEPAPPASKPRAKPGRKPKDPDAPTPVSHLVKAVWEKNPDLTPAQVVSAVQAGGCTHPKDKIAAIAYLVRSKMPVSARGTPSARDTRPPLDSPLRPAADLTLRKKMAEIVVRGGLVEIGHVVSAIGLPEAAVAELLTGHEWFEKAADGRWRLTKKGKEEGIDW